MRKLHNFSERSEEKLMRKLHNFSMRNLFVTKQFEKDLLKIPDDINTRTEKIVSQLRLNPLNPSFNIRKIKGIKSPTYQVRIGSYRLIYFFTKTSLFLLRFRHRKDIYRNFL